MDSKLLRDLEILTGLMEQGGWKSLRLHSDEISVNLSPTPQGGPERAAAQPAAPRREPEPHPATPAPSPAPIAALPASAPPSDIDPAWAVVKAPNLGTFYRSPKPGAPNFVEVGQQVQAGTELCLIEVMKLFTSVRAEQAGTVRHIAAADAELVEGGQPLMYIELA
ncbi:acetyl-CoA carboxylase, biotin carboxyl carrier protein [Altererythrobacter indicus]|uniref:Biotin carboxyl carrier protein of acetyl-CoA carboxylase n=1 Tax=Altericroceibacterium indicum TaxID=374177 RepID=A0A845A7A6_9SPHN|nr:biotin/lipoyl-containing protein [Altericroceibacterium indicum]MXP24685.1 acetyl-CoA carboxylase, biotin carboxyl carrier protein [Altericroceibacterium indicum]